jgi:hypothetical protein
VRAPADRQAYSATAGLPFDDEELESKLVWIYGSPRSGSTWLLEMLCDPLRLDRDSHLGFSWGPGWKGPALALPVNGLQVSGHLAPGIFGAASSAETLETEDATILPRTLNREVGSFPGYAFSTAYEEVWRPEARRLTLVRLHAVIDRARQAGLDLPAGIPLVVIKEVDGSHAADVVMSLFPRSRIVFLVRDGRDVIDSLLDASRPDGWLAKKGWGRQGFDTEEERLEWVREACRVWTARMNVCLQACRSHDPDRRLQVRYEDLLADTPGCLGDLERWLELPSGPKRMETIAGRHSFAAVPDAMKGAGRIHRSATPGGWRDGLTPEEQTVAHEIMGDRLAELGYETGREPA